MRQFYLFYAQADEKVNQLGSQLENKLWAIPWRHHILIIQKSKNIKEAVFYINKTIGNNQIH